MKPMSLFNFSPKTLIPNRMMLIYIVMYIPIQLIPLPVTTSKSKVNTPLAIPPLATII